MFSRTTIAASTTIPTAKASPAREMTLMERPRAAIATNEPTMETGIASTTVVVARHERRNTRSTMAASTPADVDVLLHEVEGGVDVHGLVVDLAEGEPGPLDGALLKLRGGGPEPRHRLDDVRADLALDAHRERRGAEVPDAGARLPVREAHVGHIPDGEPGDPAGRRVPHGSKEDLADVVDRLDRSLGADHVAPLAFLHLPRADRRVRRAQPGQDLAHGEAEAGEPEGIDLGPELAPAAAVDVHPAHPGHALEALAHHVLRELAERVDRPLVARLRPEDHPGDRVVLAAGGPELGLAGFGRYPETRSRRFATRSSALSCPW